MSLIKRVYTSLLKLILRKSVDEKGPEMEAFLKLTGIDIETDFKGDLTILNKLDYKMGIIQLMPENMKGIDE